jgi:acyl carrier protein
MGVSMDWATLLGAYAPPLLSHLAEEVAKHAGSAKAKRKGDGLTREKILGAESGQRQQLVETFLIEQVARVLRSSPSKLDPHQPLTKLGIDSLMAVELKNRVELDLEVTIPVTALLQGPTLAQLATLLLEQLNTPTISVPAPALAQQEIAEQLLAKVDQLSDTEVDSLLRQVIDDEAMENKLKEQEVMG